MIQRWGDSVLFIFNCFIEILSTHQKIHPFKVYSSVDFIVDFTELGNYHHKPILEHFIWTQQQSIPIPLSLLLHPKQLLIYFLYFYLFWIFHTNVTIRVKFVIEEFCCFTLIFSSKIHFEFICLYGVRWGFKFILLQCTCPAVSDIEKDYSFPVILAPLSKINSPSM